MASALLHSSKGAYPAESVVGDGGEEIRQESHKKKKEKNKSSQPNLWLQSVFTM